MSWDEELPLMFYTPVQVVNARLVPPPANRLPDWILPDSAARPFDEAPEVLPDFLASYYEKITVAVHDSSRGDTIPEPDAYQYRTSTKLSPFVMYKLKAHAAIPANQPK